MIEENLIKAIEGKVKMRENGREISLKLSPKERAIFDEATRQGFMIRKGRVETSNAFYHWCCIKNQPYVFVAPKVKYASVYLDFFSTNRELREDALETLRDIVRRYTVIGGYYFVGTTRPGSGKVKIEDAEAFAKEMLEFANSHAISIEGKYES